MSKKSDSADVKSLNKAINRVVTLKLKLEPIDMEYLRKTRKIKEEIKDIESDLLECFKTVEMDGIKTKKGICTIKESEVPVIKDKDEFFKFIFKQKFKAQDLIGNTCMTMAARERWNAGKEIPGVKSFTVRKINIKPVR